MPQTSQVFGPIYQTVVLDANGNGTVQFQAVGANMRLSNIFFNVSTTVRQAVCTIYKGNVAGGNTIMNSNSGSTGGNAKGNVDLFDGETVFVRWTGGDVGAIATATFTGAHIPFGERVGTSNLTFEDPIAAGDGSLIFPQIKSPDFVTGVSGWIVRRDGSVEFSDAVIRGSISADNGNITLNDSGITVVGSDQTVRLIDGGIVVSLNTDPSSFVLIAGSPAFGGVIFLSPLSSTVGGIDFDAGILYASRNETLTASRPFVKLISPAINGSPSLHTSQILLHGQASDSPTDDAYIEFVGKFSRPGVSVTLPVGGGGLPNNAVTTITPTAALSNFYGFWDGSSDFITVSKDGEYDLGNNLRFATNATGFRQARLVVNGAELINWTIPAVTGFNTIVGGSTRTILNAGDQVKWAGFQNSGAGLQIIGASCGWARLVEG